MMKDSKGKPSGYWNIKENCLQESLKYKTRGEFQKKSSGAYLSSLRNGWLDEICSHMIELKKHAGYWTKENCRKEALKYKSRFKFSKESRGAYNATRRNGWLDEVCTHMGDKTKPNGYWTKENCRKEALKYKSRFKFSKGSKSAYHSSLRNGWLDEICSHMIELKKVSGHWNIKENCRKEALKYNTRNEFKKKSVATYNATRRNGWLDELCSHMEVVGNRNKRCIYSFEFGDNYVYVGLTYNIKMRYESHMNDINSSVYKHIEETKLTPKFNQLTDYMDKKLASKEETVWKNKYITEGWNVLNKKKTGGLGGCIIKWDYDSCQKEALKYKTKKEFQKGSGGAYRSSCKNGWLDEVCSHMIEIIKPKGYWTKENCRKEALKYNTRNEFRKSRGWGYGTSRKNGWLDEFFPKTQEGLG